MAGELDAGARQLLQPGALGAVADDDEPTARDRPDPLPELEQQIDALVVDEPAQRHEQRRGGALALRGGLPHPVVHHSDPAVGDAQFAQGARRGRETAIIRWSR